MSDLAQPQSNISLEIPFAEQDYIQSLLGYPEIDPESIVASPELLYNFINVVDQWLPTNFLKGVSGIKVGFERKVLIDSETQQYRVESQFVSDQNWRSKYDLEILEDPNNRFLVDPREEEEVKSVEQDSESSEQELEPYNLATRISEEINRLYPKLRESIEIHIYVFWKPSLNTPGLMEPEVQTQSSCPCYLEDGSHVSNHRHRYNASGQIETRCSISGC